jgi:hypothetical protein
MFMPFLLIRLANPGKKKGGKDILAALFSGLS